jgi:DNA polymerase elongation subunit (family B)
VHGGQTIQYLVANSKSGRVNERVLAAQLTKPDTRHDIEEYLKILISAAETLLESSDTTKNKILAQVLHHEKQTMLR